MIPCHYKIKLAQITFTFISILFDAATHCIVSLLPLYQERAAKYSDKEADGDAYGIFEFRGPATFFSRLALGLALTIAGSLIDNKNISLLIRGIAPILSNTFVSTAKDTIDIEMSKLQAIPKKSL